MMTPARVIIVSSVMFTFITYWRTAAVVLCDLASTAYYIGGIVEQVVGPALLMPGNYDDNVRAVLQKLGVPVTDAAVAYADNALSDLRNREGMA